MKFGIFRKDAEGQEIFIPSSFSRISNLVDLSNERYHKFGDIANLPVTQVLKVRREPKGDTPLLSRQTLPGTHQEFEASPSS